MQSPRPLALIALAMLHISGRKEEVHSLYRTIVVKKYGDEHGARPRTWRGPGPGLVREPLRGLRRARRYDR
jgi:hypothetical protein